MSERDKINVIVCNLDHKPAMAEGLVKIYDNLISEASEREGKIDKLKDDYILMKKQKNKWRDKAEKYLAKYKDYYNRKDAFYTSPDAENSRLNKELDEIRKELQDNHDVVARQVETFRKVDDENKQLKEENQFMKRDLLDARIEFNATYELLSKKADENKKLEESVKELENRLFKGNSTFLEFTQQKELLLTFKSMFTDSKNDLYLDMINKVLK